MAIKNRIIDRHGRIENIKLYDKDPTPYNKALEEARRKEAERLKKAAADAAKFADDPSNGGGAGAGANQAAQDEAKKNGGGEGEAEEVKIDEEKFVEYEDEFLRIYDIFQKYGVESKSQLEKEVPNLRK